MTIELGEEQVPIVDEEKGAGCGLYCIIWPVEDWVMLKIQDKTPRQ